MCNAIENICISNCKYYLLSIFFLSHICPSSPALFQKVVIEIEKGFNPLDKHIKPGPSWCLLVTGTIFKSLSEKKIYLVASEFRASINILVLDFLTSKEPLTIIIFI